MGLSSRWAKKHGGNFLTDIGQKLSGKSGTSNINPWERLKTSGRNQMERDVANAGEAVNTPTAADKYYSDALRQMSEVANTGETAADRDEFNKSLARSQQSTMQNQDALAANMRKRGQVGSGLEYLGSQVNQQMGNEQNYNVATDRASQLQANRTSALQSLAGMAGSQQSRENSIAMFNKQQADAALEASKNRNLSMGKQGLSMFGDILKNVI